MTRSTGRPVEPLGEDLLPGLAGHVAGDAAVDHRPALSAVGTGLAVAQQPQIDVVQRKGQTHAHPAHARRDLQRRAGGRQLVAEGIGELMFQRIGHGELRARL